MAVDLHKAIILRNFKTKHLRCIKMHFWNPYDKKTKKQNKNKQTKKDNLTLFSEKLEYVSLFDPCGTLKVNDNGSHLGNAKICSISE